MKTFSNLPIPEQQVWKAGQHFVSFNHKDNGVQTEGDEGKRYEAEFTIVDNLDEAELLRATHRHFQDATLEQQVIDNIEVEGGSAVKVKKLYDENLPYLKSADIIRDNTLIKSSEVITSTVLPVDDVIKKVNEKVANYVIDLSKGSRTAATDSMINNLIFDGNTIITIDPL
jgi:hypothetical protein